MTDVLIIGAGPAGLTAALYAKRYGLNVIVFEKLMAGGQVATTPEVENYPGFEKITGLEFSLTLKNQVTALDIPIKDETVISSTLSGDIKKIETNQGVYESKTVIIANGATRRKLGCIGEDELSGRGVSYCASCDGFFFRNRDVVIVGGGNTALEDALFLANICSKVYIVHRKDTFRGMHSLQNAVKENKKIEVLYDSNIKAIQGENTVTSVIVSSKNNEYELKTSGVFIAIGSNPDNSMFSNEVKTDSLGYIQAGEDCTTNVSGVYVGGDTRTKPFRQIVTATGDGAVCAFMAANYVNANFTSK